jgi:putative transcriptional regulator
LKTLIKEYREKNGLTQDEFAQELGVSRQTINAIEKGRYIASLPLALTIAHYFQVTVETLFILEKENI